MLKVRLESLPPDAGAHPAQPSQSEVPGGTSAATPLSCARDLTDLGTGSPQSTALAVPGWLGRGFALSCFVEVLPHLSAM